MSTMLKRWTVNEIKRFMRAAGSHWFDPNTMRFFETEVERSVYQGPGGVYFVTSEQPPYGPRRWSVRQFWPSAAEIGTVGEFCEVDRDEAMSAALRLARTPLRRQFADAVSDLDHAITGLDKDSVQPQYDLESAVCGSQISLSDGRTRLLASKHSDGSGFSLVVAETGLVANTKAWNDNYALRREVERILGTVGDTVGSAETTAETFKPVSDLEQFLADCQKHGNQDAKEADCRRLMQLARAHHLYMESQCNGCWPYRNHDSEEPPSVVRICRASIEAVAGQVGAAGVVFSGDPRGCTVKLTWRDGETNDFAKEGWCVPRFSERAAKGNDDG